MPDPTHRHVKNPAISARFLADYMAATDRGRRSIIVDSKYPAIAPLMQHDDARATVGKHFWASGADEAWLREEAERVRRKLADSDFERTTNEVNADYIARFAEVMDGVELPKCEFDRPGKPSALMLAGVRVTPQLIFRTRRRTKFNDIRIGAGCLRYLKNRPLAQEIADWQTSFVHGYLVRAHPEPTEIPEGKLCLVVDAYVGRCFAAPTNAVSRFLNMEAACEAISERWPNVPPPKNAILS